MRPSHLPLAVSGVIATVFGCSGFLGRYVVSALGDIGSQVVCPYRGDGMNIRELRLAGDIGQIVPIPVDFADEATIRKAVARSNVVVNLLGQQQETSNYSLHDANVKVVYRLAKVAREAGVERFIHVSCLGADLNSSSEYFRTKAQGEAVVKDFFPDATILKCAPIFGRGDTFLFDYAKQIYTYYAIAPPRRGMQTVQPIWCNDVALAVLNVLKQQESLGKTYELGGPEKFLVRQLINMVAKSMAVTEDDLKFLEFDEYGWKNVSKWVQYTPAKHPHDNENGKGMLGFLKGLHNVWRHLRATRSHKSPFYNMDQWERADYDLIVDQRALKIQDLGVEPQSLLAHIDEVVKFYRFQEGAIAPRFIDPLLLKKMAHNA